jgi:hypothetical protein
MATPPIRFSTRAGACALAVATLAGLGGVAYAVDAPQGHSRPTKAAARQPVLAPRGASLIALSVRVSHHGVVAGGDSRYRLHIVRACRPIQVCGYRHHRQATRVWLHVVGPMPPGLTATFGQRATRLLAAALTVRTSAATAPGTYRLHLRASLRGTRNPLRRTWITVTLTVTAASQDAVTIAGSPARPLLPGAVVPIDLLLRNAHDSRLVVAGMSVRIQRLSAPNADAAHPCTTADFAVSQFSGAYGFALEPSSTRSLAELGIAPDQWPALAMLDRPVNQDGCQGATISLAYGATVTGGSK